MHFLCIFSWNNCTDVKLPSSVSVNAHCAVKIGPVDGNSAAFKALQNFWAGMSVSIHLYV